ncbi:hypothetical protein TNIN_253801 [Trichonephila inaurata madagascariensis]|uniref:Uncharacterized protein n=1 Tax=Trichonephila inaurata madagascariensis TaxID=2747483 RepID=A0A8X6YMW4_9ARAC|nr:hypothetical protein TNIN_253801 [Trichonephila inaurata madagascariensis]
MESNALIGQSLLYFNRESNEIDTTCSHVFSSNASYGFISAHRSLLPLQREGGDVRARSGASRSPEKNRLFVSGGGTSSVHDSSDGNFFPQPRDRGFGGEPEVNPAFETRPLERLRALSQPIGAFYACNVKAVTSGPALVPLVPQRKNRLLISGTSSVHDSSIPIRGSGGEPQVNPAFETRAKLQSLVY